MFENPVSLIITLIVVNIPVYIGIGWVLFRSWESFFEAIRYSLIPDLFSMFTGELTEDWWAEFRLAIWGFVSVLIVWGEYAALSPLLLKG